MSHCSTLETGRRRRGATKAWPMAGSGAESTGKCRLGTRAWPISSRVDSPAGGALATDREPRAPVSGEEERHDGVGAAADGDQAPSPSVGVGDDLVAVREIRGEVLGTVVPVVAGGMPVAGEDPSGPFPRRVVAAALPGPTIPPERDQVTGSRPRPGASARPGAHPPCAGRGAVPLSIRWSAMTGGERPWVGHLVELQEQGRVPSNASTVGGARVRVTSLLSSWNERDERRRSPAKGRDRPRPPPVPRRQTSRLRCAREVPTQVAHGPRTDRHGFTTG